MDYKLLSKEMMDQMKDQRLLAYEQAHYEAVLILEEMEITGSKPDAIKAQKEVIAGYKKLINGIKGDVASPADK